MGPFFQRSLTFTCNSKVKKSLGVNSPKKKKGSTSTSVTPVAKRNQHPIGYQLERDKQSKSKSNNDQDKSDQGTENRDQTVKSKRKRGIEDEDVEENGHESHDPFAQKKPGVVCSIDLHRKFVTAVNQLGIEKAVPKRILDLMNVDGITRENVASHLQVI
ncbi:hypothetical protein L2E82_00442 [Cichorium intybus]|uniref:Uncharacterized protein n=1 Tax=Cichorium intybus TaxID=13427 RepID=A0ACB9GXH8_CICIN|nr:hypothetical protein L2E82_00442 [Cichorium intybus]